MCLLSGLGALFSVGVEACKGRCVCDVRCAVVLHCWVGSDCGPNRGEFVVLKARGVVTGGVA